jgi:hypothetical protein
MTGAFSGTRTALASGCYAKQELKFRAIELISTLRFEREDLA